MDIGRAIERPIMAALDIRYTDTRRFPQRFEARLGVLLLVFDQAEPFPHHFACILIAPLSDESLDKLSLTSCKNDVARRHSPVPRDCTYWHTMPS